MAPVTHCQHRSKENGALCEQALDARGHHAMVCESGGALPDRHNAVRDWLSAWIHSRTGRPAPTEQFVPRWDRVNPRTKLVELARLDVFFVDAEGRDTYVDVTIVGAATVSLELERGRVNRDGAAASSAEDRKRLRYPGPSLVPFAIEALGRPGDAAATLLRSLAPTDPDERSACLHDAWQTLSVHVQTWNAELLMSAA